MNLARYAAISLSLLITLFSSASQSNEKVSVEAAYIPLADHYAGIVAFEKYRDEMKIADFSIDPEPERVLLLD